MEYSYDMEQPERTFSTNDQEGSAKRFSTETIAAPDKETFRDLLAIEQRAVPDESLDEADLRTALENPRAITIALRDRETQNIIGFISALPNSDVYDELYNDDPAFENNPQKLYVYDIAIDEDARGLKNFLGLVRPLIEQAKGQGFQALTMHTRTSEGLSDVLQKRYGARLVRIMENWQGWGRYDYLELDL